MPTHQKSFDRIDDIPRQNNKVFVVPVFQRPYAWDATQIQQLLDDIETGSRRKPLPFHYLSPIHVVEIDSCSQQEWPETPSFYIYVSHEHRCPAPGHQTAYLGSYCPNITQRSYRGRKTGYVGHYYSAINFRNGF